MTMVANNYLDESRPHKEVIEMMVLGFTGKLQQWWNNCLTEVSKEDIKYAIQKDEEGNPIINEIEQGVPDGVNTLNSTRIMHSSHNSLFLQYPRKAGGQVTVAAIGTAIMIPL